MLVFINLGNDKMIVLSLDKSFDCNRSGGLVSLRSKVACFICERKCGCVCAICIYVLMFSFLSLSYPCCRSSRQEAIVLNCSTICARTNFLT